MNTVNQYEQQLKEAKELIERREMALKLRTNREFKKLILEDYLVTEAARLIGAAGDPNLTPKMQADMVEMAKGTGHLKRYLSVIITMGNSAEADISELEDAIAEARSEEDIETNRIIAAPIQVDEPEGGLV